MEETPPPLIIIAIAIAVAMREVLPPTSSPLDIYKTGVRFSW
jgi:hypothetical protein